MKIIRVHGTDQERGLQYGQQARKEIHYCIHSYKDLFKAKLGCTPEEILAKAKPFEHYIPDRYIEEMKGIAKGAEVSYDDILILNCHPEIMPSTAYSSTSFSLNTGITAQTWDAPRILRGTLVAYEVQREQHTSLFFCEAGLIGSQGLNNLGIAVNYNPLTVLGDGTGIPTIIKMRMALEKETFEDALSVLNTGPFSTGASFIVSSIRENANLECCINGAHIVSQNTVLVHTNHYTSNRLTVQDQNSKSLSTLKRLKRIRELIHTNALTITDCEDILRDHVNAPSSICLHPDRSLPLLQQSCTNSALVFNLVVGTAYVTEGNPCEAGYVAYPLEMLNVEV